jgi:hypothetical protein
VPEINGIKQALVQTQALERVQEAARRQGEHQQQTFAASLNRQVDAREHQVNEGERAAEEELDPNARQKKEEEALARRRQEQGEENRPDPVDEEEDRGRHIDARA